MKNMNDSGGGSDGLAKVRKGGFQPVNEGYQPGDKRGFSPTAAPVTPPTVPTTPITGGTATTTPVSSSTKE